MHEIGVRLPKLGLTMEEGVVVDWYVDVGDEVEAGDEIAAIETDKTTAMVESPCSGRVQQVLVPAGESLPVGTLICVIERRN